MTTASVGARPTPTAPVLGVQALMAAHEDDEDRESRTLS